MHSGSVNPQLKSTTRTAGREPERDALAEPRLRVDLAGLLVAHAGDRSASAASSSPKRARLTNWPGARLGDELVVLDDHLAADEHDLAGRR